MIEKLEAKTGKTMDEMQNYLLNNTDRKTVNELLQSGMNFYEAITLAYIAEIKNRP